MSIGYESFVRDEFRYIIELNVRPVVRVSEDEAWRMFELELKGAFNDADKHAREEFKKWLSAIQK